MRMSIYLGYPWYSNNKKYNKYEHVFINSSSILTWPFLCNAYYVVQIISEITEMILYFVVSLYANHSLKTLIQNICNVHTIYWMKLNIYLDSNSILYSVHLRFNIEYLYVIISSLTAYTLPSIIIGAILYIIYLVGPLSSTTIVFSTKLILMLYALFPNNRISLLPNDIPWKYYLVGYNTGKSTVSHL